MRRGRHAGRHASTVQIDRRICAQLALGPALGQTLDQICQGLWPTLDQLRRDDFQTAAHYARHVVRRLVHEGRVLARIDGEHTRYSVESGHAG